jgi:undecaprenyl diphosphate synthase
MATRQQHADRAGAEAAASITLPSAGARSVALIADGNGRWAEEHGLSVAEGHEAAADTVIARLADAEDLGVRELTVYAFSTENWGRPPSEVAALIDLFAQRVAQDLERLHRKGVRIRFLGRLKGLADRHLETMRRAEALTANNPGLKLFVAFNYGGRAEILDAARAFHGGSEQEFRELLYAPEMHDPDVIIRTGGERRLSNFLLWHAAYCELVFRDELWPDFDRRAFETALAEFASRQRRFGGRSTMMVAGEPVALA